MEFLWQRGANDTAAVADGGNAIADGDWTHLVFTGSAAGDYQFYVNGVPTTGGAFPDTFGHVNTNPLFIGSRNDLFTTWDGLLDDVAIFDRVLTEGQIQTILSGEFSEFLEPPSADFNGDGVVTELDYFVLSDHLYAHLDGPVVRRTAISIATATWISSTSACSRPSIRQLSLRHSLLFPNPPRSVCCW
jgi:hypothetical protein